jgi:hypothetical protein
MEKDLSRTLMNRMKLFGHFVRIENMVGVGMPDVSYCIEGHEGFIENKWRASWPRDPGDVVTLDHFTPQQRIWIRQRCAAKGRVYVLLEVERPVRQYLLLPGLWSAKELGVTATQRTIESMAIVRQERFFPIEALRDALT